MSIGAVNSSLMEAANQVYQTTAGAKAGQVENEGSDKAATEDTLALSSEGRKALHMPPLFGVEPGKPITIADMKSFGAEQLNAFGKKFRALMRDNDIDMSQPITLGHEPGTGRIIVTNDHPDAEKIEALLEENRDLCNMYTGAISALTLAKHCEEHVKFAEAYAKNPQAAVAQYAYLFSTSWDANVTFSDDSYEVDYSRVPRR